MKALLQANSNDYLRQPTVQTSLGLDVTVEENEAFDSARPFTYFSYHSPSYSMASIYLCFSKWTILCLIFKLIENKSSLLTKLMSANCFKGFTWQCFSWFLYQLHIKTDWRKWPVNARPFDSWKKFVLEKVVGLWKLKVWRWINLDRKYYAS